MKINNFVVCLVILLLFVNQYLQAQVSHSSSVTISGEVASPVKLNLNDISQFIHTDVTRKDKDGTEDIYSGVPLSVLLQKAGVSSGKDIHGKNLTKYVLVDASDGYQVVFALAELDKEFTDRSIILADRVNGKPLPTGAGPFQIIVQNEKKAARCIRMVTAIKVQSAK